MLLFLWSCHAVLNVKVSGFTRECYGGNCPQSAEPARTASNCKKKLSLVTMMMMLMVMVMMMMMMMLLVAV